jgi:predicted outer membrane protein
MSLSRYSTGTFLVAATLIVTIVALVYPVMTGVQASGSSPDVQTVSTQYGPLTHDEVEFVQKVRLAGLWEFPSGQMALQKGTTPAFKTTGRHLIDGHAALDAACREIAPQLGIPLPNRPTRQQQGFVATLSAATGEDFNRQLANILRVAHGQIFSTIAKVRATTKNTLVRRLADQANDTVLDHITVLEQTGYVDLDRSVPVITASPTADPDQTRIPVPRPGERNVTIKSTPGALSPGELLPLPGGGQGGAVR